MTQEIEVTLNKPSGSIIAGALMMFIISLLLFWVPLLGPIIAGIAGGKKAGGMSKAVLAVFLPAILSTIILVSLAGSLTGIPLIGIIAGSGAVIISFIHVIPLLLGAMLGGAMA